MIVTSATTSKNNLRADGPLSIIPTPTMQTGKDDVCTAEGSHMALVHNVLIRGYNSIYLQAPLVKTQDVPDFLQYCHAWYLFITEHHDGEEQLVFPEIEKTTGIKGIMDEDIGEHEAFFGGLHKLGDYIQACITKPSEYDGAKLVEMLDAFGGIMHVHLAKEPMKFASLAKHNVDLKQLMADLAERGRGRMSARDVLPILFYNMDVDFEGGRWSNFPPLPPAVMWFMVNILSWWRSNWWRFGSSSKNGHQRELLCLKTEYVESV